jgi:hypothetical protein
MADDRKPTPVEKRIDPQTIFEGATAAGVAAGGTGTLLLGVAKIKETFGGDKQPPPETNKD